MKHPEIISVVEHICDKLLAHTEELNRLDAVMGDGEHGSNIERTFSQVQAQIPQIEELEIFQIFDKIGAVLLAAGGGTATTLMGFACRKTGVLIKKEEHLDAPAVSAVMSAVWESIQAKSQAQIGDKTLMDAYTPAVKAFADEARQNTPIKKCFHAAAKAAANGAEATKQMIAKRGRGYYVGERGLGVADPGAVSVSLIFMAISEAIEER